MAHAHAQNNSENKRNDLASTVMGTIFLVIYLCQNIETVILIY